VLYISHQKKQELYLSDITSVILLFIIAFTSGFINVGAGGGSSLTLPMLIFLGLDSAVANGTNRVGIMMQNIAAIYSFKQSKFSQFRLSLKLSLLTLPGAIAGAILAVKLNDELFQKILGVVMILIIISMFLPKAKNTADGESSQKISWSVYLSMFGIGFYGGFLQVGVGFMIMASLQHLMKLNLVYVNMHKVFIVLVFTLPALLIFAFTGNVNWFWGIMLGIGNASGGWWSARLSVKKGEKLIKVVLVAAIFIMALKLLNVF
jgi:uncharacterized membrane protein YfcA